jgi:hypothetical protein
MISGAKKIGAVVLVAAVVYGAASFAMPHLLEIPAINSAFGVIAEAASSVWGSVLSGINATLAFFHIGAIETLSIPAAEIASTSNMTSATLATGAGIATAATMISADPITTANLHNSMVTSHSALTSNSALNPDITSHLQQIDPSNVALKSGSSFHSASTSAATSASSANIGDLPTADIDQHHAQHPNNHGGKLPRMGHHATQIEAAQHGEHVHVEHGETGAHGHKDKKRPGANATQHLALAEQTPHEQNIRNIEAKLNKWQNRVGQNGDKTSGFAKQINAERDALSHDIGSTKA